MACPSALSTDSCLNEPVDCQRAGAYNYPPTMEARAVGKQLASDWRALQSAIAGDVVLPGAGEYAVLRKPPVARFDDSFLTVSETTGPEAIVLCREPADAATTIAVARRLGLKTAVRSGGHCFAGRSFTSGVVIDVSPMRSV